MLTRRTIMLKPMQTGASGYARLQTENARVQLQVHARGLENGAVRLFACLSGQSAREIGTCAVNANGEASLEAELAQDNRLEGLVMISGGDHPRPLLTGLCITQSAGALLEVKNAALALCERLRKKPEVRPVPVPVVNVERKALPPLPREIFLPAIDPAPYFRAEKNMPAPPVHKTVQPSVLHTAEPVNVLPKLRWPRGFESLRTYFEKEMPSALFDLPGWRFVSAAPGLWIGMQPQDGIVRRVAYAYDGNAPRGQGPYQPVKGLDGRVYQVLWQEV